jgi:hypothetical protein
MSIQVFEFKRKTGESVKKHRISACVSIDEYITIYMFFYLIKDFFINIKDLNRHLALPIYADSCGFKK